MNQGEKIMCVNCPLPNLPRMAFPLITQRIARQVGDEVMRQMGYQPNIMFDRMYQPKQVTTRITLSEGHAAEILKLNYRCFDLEHVQGADIYVVFTKLELNTQEAPHCTEGNWYMMQDPEQGFVLTGTFNVAYDAHEFPTVQKIVSKDANTTVFYLAPGVAEGY